MANISGIQTVDNINLLSVDADPSLAGGTPSPIGSIATVSDGSGLYLKTGVSDTDYTKVAVNNSAVSFSQITLNGNLTSAAWTTNGIRIKETAGTFTDTTSSGTVAAAYSGVIGGDTIAASNPTVFTDYYGMYIKTPIAGTNVTFTNSWALGLQGGANIGGRVNVGNYASPNNLRQLTIGQDTAYVSIGSRVGTTSEAAMYFNVASPTSGTYNLTTGNSSTEFYVNSPSAVKLQVGTISIVSVFTNQLILTPFAATNGSPIHFTFTVPASTGQTTSTEIPNFKVTGNTKTWAAGTIATQRWNYLTANTAAFASASTITNSYGLYVEAATAGTNATITNNYALGLNGAIGLTSNTLFSAPAAGAIEYDGNFWGTEASTLRKAFVGNIYTQTTSVTVANTVTETSLLTSTVTLPANFFTIGKQLNIKVRGFHSGVSTPTIRIRVKLGSTVILDTGVINSGNSTNAYFDIDGVICCRTVGATGTVMSQGYFTELGGGAGAFGMTNTAAATIDTTASLVYDVTVEWGTASASNTITSTNGYVCVMK